MPQEHTSSEQPRPSRRRRRKRAGASFVLFYIIFVIGISALLACIGWIAANDMLALNKQSVTATITLSEDMFTAKEETDENGETHTVYYADLGEVADLLEENGLIEYKLLFRLFAAFTHASSKISQGTFTLDTNMDYRALISGMSANSSSRAQVSVTIPEGYTVEQIFELLEEKGVARVEELNDMAANHDYAFDFLEDIPLGDPKRLEGYLYPDTYTFYTPHSALYVINKMLVNFDSVYNEDMRQQVANSGYSLHQILTVASMIEKETDGTDRGKISSVIFNRLNPSNSQTAGLLQIDATLVYLTGRVPTEEDKTIDSPYNTYRYKGLPPGPISNPGLESIEAALSPEKTNYYYYALGDDDMHHFSSTYAEHQQFLASQKRYQ